jgi:hypothetical protein
MRLRNISFIKVSLFLVITVFTFAGCSGTLFNYKGDKVTQKDMMVPLKDGNQQGVWKTNELAIKYQYQMTPESLKFAGNIELVGGFAIGFRLISNLSVYLLFLDNQGIVIENVLFYSIGNRQSSDTFPMAFETTMPIPEGTRTISFAYDGELTGAGAMNQAPYSFWFSPTRR